MRWLPDYGVGIIAFGNVTYTGWNNAVGGAIDRLDRTGGLRPREVRPSAALIAARDDVSKLVAGLGRRAGRQDRRREPVHGPVEGPAAQRD